VLRAASIRLQDNQTEGTETSLEVAGKRGIGYFRFRKIVADATYTQFEDRPQFGEIEVLADRYIKMFLQGTIDRLDVVFTPVCHLVAADRDGPDVAADHDRGDRAGYSFVSVRQAKPAASAELPPPSKKGEPVPYEFLPDPRSILEESYRFHSRSVSSNASWTRP